MWDLPRPGLEPVSPALAGGFLTTEPPRKSLLSTFVISFLTGKPEAPGGTSSPGSTGAGLPSPTPSSPPPPPRPLRPYQPHPPEASAGALGPRAETWEPPGAGRPRARAQRPTRPRGNSGARPRPWFEPEAPPPLSANQRAGRPAPRRPIVGAARHRPRRPLPGGSAPPGGPSLDGGAGGADAGCQVSFSAGLGPLCGGGVPGRVRAWSGTLGACGVLGGRPGAGDPEG